MSFLSLLPDPHRLHLLSLTADDGGITLTARPCSDVACCPLCGQPSSRVHSSYRRILADLPWQGIPARVLLWTRRFFCDAPDCVRRIFTERLPGVALPYAHRTDRLRDWFTHVAFALGGEAGGRLLRALGVSVSGDTLLAHIRAAAIQASPAPRVLSVDDFAVRRGRTYGSILVDLESHRVVDLLPDRSGHTFAAWLTADPGAEIISRDRGGEYAEAARRAAPAAIHTAQRAPADRFHLLRGCPLGGMRDVVLRVFKRHAKRIAQVALPAAEPGSLIRLRPDRVASRERTRREIEDRFNAIQQLAAQGMNRSAIARALGIHRHTVQKYYPLTAAPERRHTTRKTSALTPYEGYVLERWRGGCHNAKQLWREIVARGYPGAYRGVALLARHLRDRERAGQPLQRAPTGLTPAGATGIAVMRPEKRGTHERHALAQVAALHAELQATLALFASFAALLREREEGEPSARLDQWMAEATSSGTAEIRAFATKLRQDREAVLAALTVPHSQGQTEGQVNKLKLVKRAMYGRAKFDLLRQRILYTAT